MNISDFKIDYKEHEGKDRLEVMFEMHDQLRKHYKIPILDLDLPSDQQIAREFAWNVVEETGEALEVYTGSEDREHLLDEVADAFSFYLELLQISGLNAKDLVPSHKDIGDSLAVWFNAPESSIENRSTVTSHSFFVMKLALAINNLKNRKWRKTHLKTNTFIYKKDLYNTFPAFIQFIKEMGLNAHDLFDAYLRKHKVNMFRINSKY